MKNGGEEGEGRGRLVRAVKEWPGSLQDAAHAPRGATPPSSFLIFPRRGHYKGGCVF